MTIKKAVKTQEDNYPGKKGKNNGLLLTTLYDNRAENEKLRADWGFSCLVETKGHRILFDTGASGRILLSNMKQLGVNPKRIDTVFLSHYHWDHTGGLFELLEKNRNLKVFLLKSFPLEFKEKIEALGASFEEVNSPTQLFKGIISTGELGSSIKEQSMIIKTGKGAVVVTGCSHPGIIEIIKKAKSVGQPGIFMAIGGFHLLEKTEAEIRTIIREFKSLGVKKAAPSHCSGEKAIELFRAEYKENFVSNSAGKKTAVG